MGSNVMEKFILCTVLVGPICHYVLSVCHHLFFPVKCQILLPNKLHTHAKLHSEMPTVCWTVID